MLGSPLSYLDDVKSEKYLRDLCVLPVERSSKPTSQCAMPVETEPSRDSSTSGREVGLGAHLHGKERHVIQREIQKGFKEILDSS